MAELRKTGQPVVGILTGSPSDLEVVKKAEDTLHSLNIPCELFVLSAHRTPEEAMSFASTARENGIGVMICAAGGAAHLAGVVSAHTSLPVLGIPLDNPPLGGLDALLATVQMPGGVPVGTLGAGRGGPVNAALLALRILAVADAELAAKLDEFRSTQRGKVLKKDEGLQAQLG